MIVAGLCGLTVLAVLIAGRLRGVRVIAAAGVAVIWGLGVAQYPVLLPGTAVTLSNAGAPHATLVAIVVLFLVAVAIVGPSFALLFSLQGRRLLCTDDVSTVLATAPAHQTQPPAGSPAPAVRAAVLALVVVDALVRALVGRRDR